MSTANRRIFYAIQAGYLAADGTQSFSYIHGLQSVGISTRFNLEQAFQLGQIDIYQQITGVPDIEVTLEKKLDGYPLMWHMATNPSPAATLVGRSATKTIFGFNVYSDLQSSASGTPIAQAQVSGSFVSQLSYSFPVQGQATESLTLVANSKVWNQAFSVTANNDDDQPLAITGSGGVQNRWDFLLGSGWSKLPSEVPGVDAVTNYVYKQADGISENAHLARVQVQCNLGREPLYELGHKQPYHRYVNFPVEIKTDIEVIAQNGDAASADPELQSIAYQPIKIMMREGTQIDLGTKNMLSSVSYGGGNAAQNGGNAQTTYSYITFNSMTILHPQDPSPGLAVPLPPNPPAP